MNEISMKKFISTFINTICSPHFFLFEKNDRHILRLQSDKAAVDSFIGEKTTFIDYAWTY